MMEFDRDATKKELKELVEQNCYLQFGEHVNLRALCITEDDEYPIRRDWCELVFVVPTEWLREFCKKEFDADNLDVFLQEEYTSDESEIIFAAGIEDRQIVVLDFCR